MRHIVKRYQFLVFLVSFTILGLTPDTSPTIEARQGQGQDKARKKPTQVLPDGKEDANPPSAEEVLGQEALEAMISRSSEGLDAVQRADGTVALDLQGRFMSVAIVKHRHDGTHGVACLTGKDALDALKAWTVPRASVAPPAAPAKKAAQPLEDRE